MISGKSLFPRELRMIVLPESSIFSLKASLLTKNVMLVAFSKDKFKYNKWGKVKIGAGLRMKKISEELITKALDSINETEYLDLLKSIIEKQRKTVRAKNQYDLKGKLLRHCLSKGFESHLVYDLLGEAE